MRVWVGGLGDGGRNWITAISFLQFVSCLQNQDILCKLPTLVACVRQIKYNSAARVILLWREGTERQEKEQLCPQCERKSVSYALHLMCLKNMIIDNENSNYIQTQRTALKSNYASTIVLTFLASRKLQTAHSLNSELDVLLGFVDYVTKSPIHRMYIILRLHFFIFCPFASTA